jgi:hypothetical protein
MLAHSNEVKRQKAKVKIAPTLRFYFLLFTFAVGISCGSKPADLRTFIPADSLVYLESNDLGAVMNAITERPAFREAAKTIPDFSVLDGVKMAVAVTGFESKEIPVTDENAVLSFQPRFVAILETNAWNFLALSFTENKLGEFINQVYGGEVVLETSDKNDGKFFVWTAKDGRKALALVQGSVVFFGNDETAIEKSLAVKRGETESIIKNPKVPQTDPATLAQGFVSTDGVAQIANIVGLTFASQTGEEQEVKSFIATIVPQILRGSISDASWTTTKTEMGMEDRYSISMPADVANVLSETMAPGEPADTSLTGFLPKDRASVTLYNFKDPQIAWRGILLLLQKQGHPVVGKLLAEFSNSLFEPYGIRDPELFLKTVGPPILTMKQDEAGEKLLVVATVKDDSIKNGRPDVEKALASDTRNLSEVNTNAAYDGNAFTRMARNVFIGDIEVVRACSNRGGHELLQELQITRDLGESKAPVITIGTDQTIALNIASAVDLKKSDGASSSSRYRTETRFSKNGIERKTESDFGFIGWIITQFGSDD